MLLSDCHDLKQLFVHLDPRGISKRCYKTEVFPILCGLCLHSDLEFWKEKRETDCCFYETDIYSPFINCSVSNYLLQMHKSSRVQSGLTYTVAAAREVLQPAQSPNASNRQGQSVNRFNQ